MNIAKTKQEKLHLRRAAKTTLKNFRIIKYNDKRTKCKIESAITELTRVDEEFGELLSLRFLKNFDGCDYERGVDTVFEGCHYHHSKNCYVFKIQ